MRYEGGAHRKAAMTEPPDQCPPTYGHHLRMPEKQVLQAQGYACERLPGWRGAGRKAGRVAEPEPAMLLSPFPEARTSAN